MPSDPGPVEPSRRALLAGLLLGSLVTGGSALSGCGAQQSAEAASGAENGPAPSIKDIAPFPIGAAVPCAYLDDPAFVALALSQLSQITPEWELKMEYVLGDAAAGTAPFRFEAPDRIAAFARDHALRFYGHALIWYAQEVPYFRDLDPSRFGAEYDRYIATVVGRYAGQAVGWDVVNEAVAEDGVGLRDCLWGRRLGGADAYIARAFHQARAADANAVLFLNDYNLENLPAKGATYLQLVERLLKAGVPIGGIASQSHLDIDISDGQIRDFYRSAAAFGLPIHVSELDASQRRDPGGPGGSRLDLRTLAYKRERQAALVGELGGAVMALPARQRFGLTTWALRDRDSWLRRSPRDDGKDSLVLFDDDGRPTVMFDALVSAIEAAPAV